MSRRPLTALFVLALAVPPVLAEDPPVARKRPHEVRVHGDLLIDNYHWLRQKKSRQVMAYLRAENAYADSATCHLKKLRDALYLEMLNRAPNSDTTVPHREGGFLYYSRSQNGEQYATHCRRKIVPDAPEEILLDVNELARGHDYCSVTGLGVSDDGGKLLYLSDFTGGREFKLTVRDLVTGKLLEDRTVRCADAVWAADGKTILYVSENDAKRPHKLFRHKLGADPSKDVPVYEEADEKFELSVSRTNDRKYVVVMSVSATTTEARVIPADAPDAPPRVLLPREDGHEYYVSHRHGRFYLRTNKGAKNFKLVAAPDDHPTEWTEVVPHRPKVELADAQLFADFVVLSEREDGLPHLCVRDLRTGDSHRVRVPEPVYTISANDNSEFDSDTLRYTYGSPVTPDTVYDYDMRTRERFIRKRAVAEGYDPSKYQCERLFAKTKDGVSVPVSLVYRKGVKMDGSAPLWLTGYGAYGSVDPLTFSDENLSILDRGVIVAQAHVRGGGDFGPAWHDGGKMLTKINTFTDFIACADYLVAAKYTSHERLAIQGMSAGGLLIGAVLNMRPDLCKVAVLNSPFVEAVNTMLDPTVPLTTQEYLEWGNPNIKREYEYLKSYCPYTNLSAKAYPAVLVTTSLNDSQVMYWEPTMYVAKMRAVKTDKNPLILKVNMSGDHGGASGRLDALRERAFEMAFVLDQLGVRK
jgi:oligopeptidase B